ncbi:hypothetical protein J2X17_002429 [Flavobacterium aquidurense]|nr:hypothetical protein [Flavobacterium aquidurense]
MYVTGFILVLKILKKNAFFFKSLILQSSTLLINIYFSQKNKLSLSQAIPFYILNFVYTFKSLNL